MMSPSASPLVDEQQWQEWRDLASPDFDLVPPEPLPPVRDGDWIFEDGAVLDGNDDYRRSVIQFGEITTSSGMFRVCDAGLMSLRCLPLGRMVAPGSYPVDLVRVTTMERIVGVRVRVGSGPAVSWVAARLITGAEASLGVDYGNGSIQDPAALQFTSLERADEVWAQLGTEPDAAIMVNLADETDGPTDCVVTGTAKGDGVFPISWGLDASGEPCELIIDYMIGVNQKFADEWDAYEANL